MPAHEPSAERSPADSPASGSHQPHAHHAAGHPGDGPTYDRSMHQADWQHVWDRQVGRDAMERDWLATLALTPGSRLVDVGSGPGYVSLLAAEQMGPTGRVYALDHSPDALAFLRDRLAERAALSVEPLVGSGEALPLADGAATHALVAQMLHHNDAPETILREVWRVLAPGGVALVVEHDPRGTPDSGPPPSERLPIERVQAWVTAAGYAAVEACPAGPDRWGLLARK